MDFFQRLGNFFGGKGWVSDEERRRKEQQQSAPQPQPQPQPQQRRPVVAPRYNQPSPALQARQRALQTNQNSRDDLIKRANDELNTEINDPNGYYKEDAEKLRHEMSKGSAINHDRVRGLLQSVQNRRKEIGEQFQEEQQMRRRIAGNPNEHRTQEQIDKAINSWRDANTFMRSNGAFNAEQYRANQQIKDMRLGAEDGNRTVGEIIDDIKGSRGISQAEKFEELDNKIKDLGEAFTDDKVQRRSLLMHARQEAEQYRQGDLGSLVRGVAKGFVDMPKAAGEGVAMAVYAADGSRERLAKSKQITADYYARELQKAIRDGDERKKAYYSYELNRENREINNILDRQVSESDPILNAGRIANAAATPVAFAAQATGVGVAAKAGVTGVAGNASRSTVSQIIASHSPQITGRLAQTTAGKVLNSTPTQIVSRVLPNASPRLQAVAAESMANVLSGVPQNVAGTASETGSRGRLEDYLINTATGVVMDAAFPVAAYGAGRGVHYAGQGIKDFLPKKSSSALSGSIDTPFTSKLKAEQAEARYKLDPERKADIQAYNDHIGQLRLQESKLLEQGLSENSAPVINNRKAQAEAIYARDHIGELDDNGVRYKLNSEESRAMKLKTERINELSSKRDALAMRKREISDNIRRQNADKGVLAVNSLIKSNTEIAELGSKIDKINNQLQQEKSSLFELKVKDSDPSVYVSSKPISTPELVYRGEAGKGVDNGNGAKYGDGLYTAASKRAAKGYAPDGGAVSTLSKKAIPSKPLQFETTPDFENWLHKTALSKGYGSAKELIADGHPINDVVLETGHDGITVGRGKDMYLVKYAPTGERVVYKFPDGDASIGRQNSRMNDLKAMGDLADRHLNLTGDEKLVFQEWRNEMERRAAGYYDPKTDTIDINQLTADTLNHELGHKLLRRTENNTELIAVVRQTVGDDTLVARYGKEYGTDNLNILAEEYLADGFSDYSRGILNGEDRVRLATRLHIPQEVVAVYDRIIEAIKSLVGKQDQIRQFYAQAETGKFRNVPQVADGDMRVREMSIQRAQDGTPVVVIENDILKGVAARNRAKVISSYFKENLQGNNYDLNYGKDGTARISAKTRNKYLDPGQTVDDLIAKGKMAGELPDILRISKKIGQAADTKNHEFAVEGFEYRQAVVKIGDNTYKVRLNVGINSKGKLLYAVNGIEKIPESHYRDLSGDFSDESIANSPRIVNDKRFKVDDSTAKSSSGSQDISPKAVAGVEFKGSLEPKRADIDEAIYSLHPELMKQYDTGKIIGRDGNEWDIPRLHVDDLAHYMGDLKENIPNYYKRRSGSRNIDTVAQEMGFDDIDEFLDRYTSAIDARREAKEMKYTISELRKDPEVLEEARRLANLSRDEARTELVGLLAERREYLEEGDMASVKAIDEHIQGVYKEAGAYLKSLPKTKKIQVGGRDSKPVEYVAVTTSRGKRGEESFELIPLDGNKHTLKNGVVVDKDGRYVGSYVGIDEAGNQYAYIEGKPMNITALVGDIDAWGNKNSPFTDLNRLIEDNAPDTQTARRVQEFTTVFKDRQEAAMKTELANKRNELAKTRYEMMKNRPKGISKDELSADMFRIMERKIPYNEVVQKYGTEYIEKYIRPTVEFYRKELDEILASTNKVLEKNGYEPIPKRKNYISHIQENPSFWQKVGLGIQDTLQLGKSTSAEANPGQVRGAIPDEIVGKTANTGARRKWNRFAQQRQGSNHVQDFFGAIDAYYEPMLFNKYMTPAASRVRMIEDTFRSFEKAKKVQFDRLAEAIGADQARTELGDRQKTHKNYKADRRSPLVMAWMEYGNMLAGKTNAIDRMLIDNGLEKWIVDPSVKAQRIVGANVIPGSATAAVAQTLSLPQMIARDTLESVLLGAKDMLVYAKRSNRAAKNDPILKSAFMRARYTDASSINKGLLRKVTDKASIPMEAIERVTGEMNWRSAYREALRKGLKGMDAINDADIATKKTLAGRGIGDRPMVMNSKAAGALTQFGLEVLNMGVQFKRDFSVGQKTKFIAAAFALNELTNMVTGQRQLPDYISAIKESYEDFMEDEELDKNGKPKRTVADKFGRLGQRLAGETAKFIPGAGSLVNLLMPDKVKEDVFGKSSDVVRFGNPAISRVAEAGHQLKEGITEGNLGKVADSGLKLAPMGQQARRTIGGLSVMSEGVNRNSKGNITNSVDRSNPVKWVQAGLFGKNALSEIKEGYLNNTKPLSGDQTKIYEEIRRKFGDDSARTYLEDVHRLREAKGNLRKAGVSGLNVSPGRAEAVRAEASIKFKSGEWREEDGLIVNSKGHVQRSYYKALAESQGESDEAYENWMKAFDIDNAGSKQPRKTGNATLDRLQVEKGKANKAATAISLMKDSEKYRDLPEWVKERYYEKSGYNKQEIEYGALASYGPKEKLYAYWLPRVKDMKHDQVVKELVNARRESIAGRMLATNGIVDNLAAKGVISSDEARAIKRTRFLSDGTPKTYSHSGRNRGGGRRGRSGGASSSVSLSSMMEPFKQSVQMSKALNAHIKPVSSTPQTGQRQLKRAALRRWSPASSSYTQKRLRSRSRR